jgi:dihydroceramidase
VKASRQLTCSRDAKTVTNILFIWLGLKGIRGCLKYSHPPIFVVAFIGYMVVGIGSTFFHATLKCRSDELYLSLLCVMLDNPPPLDPMQLVDELSMIYTTCFMCFATFSYARSTSFSVILGAGLVGLAWFITVRLLRKWNIALLAISDMLIVCRQDTTKPKTPNSTRMPIVS